MTGPEVLKIIADAIHSDCGGDNCGADEMHEDVARAVMFALVDEGLLVPLEAVEG